MYQLSAEKYDNKSSFFKNSLILNDIVLFSEITNKNFIQSNFYHKILLKKGSHKLFSETETDGKWCSNPEKQNGFQHGRYIAIYYKNKNRNNMINKTDVTIYNKMNYSVPYIISYIK